MFYQSGFAQGIRDVILIIILIDIISSHHILRESYLMLQQLKVLVKIEKIEGK